MKSWYFSFWCLLKRRHYLSEYVDRCSAYLRLKELEKTKNYQHWKESNKLSQCWEKKPIKCIEIPINQKLSIWAKRQHRKKPIKMVNLIMKIENRSEWPMKNQIAALNFNQKSFYMEKAAFFLSKFITALEALFPYKITSTRVSQMGEEKKPFSSFHWNSINFIN